MFIRKVLIHSLLWVASVASVYFVDNFDDIPGYHFDMLSWFFFSEPTKFENVQKFLFKSGVFLQNTLKLGHSVPYHMNFSNKVQNSCIWPLKFLLDSIPLRLIKLLLVCLIC